jgi:hypothetical protein
LFSQIYNLEASCRQSRVDDAIILETVKKRYMNQTGGSKFKHLHWWEAVRHQPKWRARSAGSSKIDPFLSSSDLATEEDVARPIGQDRAKVATQKGKEKEGSSSQSESSSPVGGIMSTLKKLTTTFAKVRMWKQYNKLKDRSTVNMDEEELESHRAALRLIQRDLQFSK